MTYRYRLKPEQLLTHFTHKGLSLTKGWAYSEEMPDLRALEGLYDLEVAENRQELIERRGKRTVSAPPLPEVEFSPEPTKKVSSKKSEKALETVEVPEEPQTILTNVEDTLPDDPS